MRSRRRRRRLHSSLAVHSLLTLPPTIPMDSITDTGTSTTPLSGDTVVATPGAKARDPQGTLAAGASREELALLPPLPTGEELELQSPVDAVAVDPLAEDAAVLDSPETSQHGIVETVATRPKPMAKMPTPPVTEAAFLDEANISLDLSRALEMPEASSTTRAAITPPPRVSSALSAETAETGVLQVDAPQATVAPSHFPASLLGTAPLSRSRSNSTDLASIYNLPERKSLDRKLSGSRKYHHHHHREEKVGCPPQGPESKPASPPTLQESPQHPAKRMGLLRRTSSALLRKNPSRLLNRGAPAASVTTNTATTTTNSSSASSSTPSSPLIRNVSAFDDTLAEMQKPTRPGLRTRISSSSTRIASLGSATTAPSPVSRKTSLSTKMRKGISRVFSSGELPTAGPQATQRLAGRTSLGSLRSLQNSDETSSMGSSGGDTIIIHKKAPRQEHPVTPTDSQDILKLGHSAPVIYIRNTGVHVAGIAQESKLAVDAGQVGPQGYVEILRDTARAEERRLSLVERKFRESGWCSTRELEDLREKKEAVARLWRDRINEYRTSLESEAQ
ncbi:uncharacterized protein KNAG_0L01000 [Huiozyma naganishii CBS 8797]|uniref:Uncharacterized protein n=1 Tax=Huiozyma naganishii (strain ATCC MYA-139 / BCRC 22969 / CBS 8797 / KCTC 17520 / NBRC 10181 / NCYC 3082 / Yp74L-3) TaxID=1071383 RepID=J7S3N1_HUIN7|nr:hypothetical protein KNAG_0L01000 [Kazachstania naganishii CBS 8797]CCK72722.1 hypothetical protein KNAG_0L01000 [Kazachstania naganishii CBS 8797]